MQAKQQFRNRESFHQTKAKAATLPRKNYPKNTQNPSGAHPKRMNDESTHHGAKSHKNSDANRLSQSPSKNDLMREHVNSIQNSTSKATMRAANPPQLNKEPGIIDGYLENVSDVLMMEHSYD